MGFNIKRNSEQYIQFFPLLCFCFILLLIYKKFYMYLYIMEIRKILLYLRFSQINNISARALFEKGKINVSEQKDSCEEFIKLIDIIETLDESYKQYILKHL